MLDNLKDLKEIGITVFRLELFDEQKDEIIEIVNMIRKIRNEKNTEKN